MSDLSLNASSHSRVLHCRSSATFAGPERHILELASPLRQYGFEVTTLALYRNPTDEDLPHPLVARARIQGVGACQVNDTGWISRQSVESIHQKVRRDNYSILHTHDYKSNLLGLLAARKAGIPIVATVHLHTQTDWKLHLYRLLDLAILRAFNHVILVSASLRSGLLKLSVSSNRVSVIPNGIDAQAFAAAVETDSMTMRKRLGLDCEHPIVLGIGRLTTQKGFRYLLQAVPSVKAKCPEVRFVIVGDGPERNNLERLASELGVTHLVSWLGHRNDIVNVMTVADVVVLPSLREGLPYVLLEAFALARPVVASSVGGIPLLVHDDKTGFTVPPRDPVALSRAIVCMIAQPDTAATMGLRGQALVYGEFSAETMARRVAHVYRRLLEG